MEKEWNRSKGESVRVDDGSSTLARYLMDLLWRNDWNSGLLI
jgi:hypothetical protein